MEIREYTEYRAEEILPLYAAVGWTAYTDEPSVLERGFRNSLLVLAAYEDGAPVGIVRAVGDGATVVFVQDTSWSVRTGSGRGSARHCSGRCFRDTLMYG